MPCQLFSPSLKKMPWGRSTKFNFKNKYFLMIIKLSTLNNINIKNRTQKKLLIQEALNHPHPGLWDNFPLSFLVSRKVIRSGDETCWPYMNQSTNTVFIFKIVAYYRKTNKKELTKGTTRRKIYWSLM